MAQDFSDLVGSIMSGEYDEDLDGLEAAVRERARISRDAKVATLALTLKPGQRVRIGEITPKSLDGATGKVVKVLTGRGKKRADVELDREAYFHGSMHKVAEGIPLSCLTVIE